MPDRMPADMSEYMPEDMPDRMPDRMPEDMSDRRPEDMPDRMHQICQIECQKICQIECQKICQIECQKICQIECHKKMPDRMPDRMPEDMSDKMPEDLPVRKSINVMVGITRSKVIFVKSFTHASHFLVPVFFGQPDSPTMLLYTSSQMSRRSNCVNRFWSTAFLQGLKTLLLWWPFQEKVEKQFQLHMFGDENALFQVHHWRRAKYALCHNCTSIE